MPTVCSKDSIGCFCQWGNQKKYYYKCGDDAARERAKDKANRQGQAAHSGGYKDKSVNNYTTGFKGKI
jgi:hypothetical protein